MKMGLIAFAAVAVSTSAQAATPVNFNFGSVTGNLGNTRTYTDTGGSGLQVIASGFDNNNRPTALYGKNQGGDEIGLGLVNDPAGQGEIYYGYGFVQIDVRGLFGKVTGVKFLTNSTTDGEQWSVFGSNNSGSYSGAALLTGTTETSSSLPGFGNYNYYDFVSTANKGGKNFLLSSLTAVSSVPEPTTWAMTLVGFGAMGASVRYRRRKSSIAYS